jgi:hypothetical protein
MIACRTDLRLLFDRSRPAAAGNNNHGNYVHNTGTFL